MARYYIIRTGQTSGLLKPHDKLVRDTDTPPTVSNAGTLTFHDANGLLAAYPPAAWVAVTRQAT